MRKRMLGSEEVLAEIQAPITIQREDLHMVRDLRQTKETIGMFTLISITLVQDTVQHLGRSAYHETLYSKISPTFAYLQT